MMVPIQVIRWYRMQCYDGTDSCATVVPNRRYCQMIQQFDTFVQLKSLYKAGLKLHKLGLVKIKAIRFDMSFYSPKEADEMFELYGSDDIIKITDNSIPKGKEIPAGKAWIYI